MKIALIILLSFCIITSVFAQQPKGNRILSYQIDKTENNNLDSAVHYANKACMESVHLTFSWSNMESNPNQIEGPLFDLLTLINIYYPTLGIKVDFHIPVINTVLKDVPSDLMPVSFSSPVMINRFKILLDSIFPKIPNVDIAAFFIGTECDGYLADANAYDEFKIFLDSVTPHAKQKYFSLYGKNLKVGTTFTWSGLTGEQNPNTEILCKFVNQERDFIGTTYFPLDSNYQVKNPNLVSAEFGQLITEYPDTLQPIYIAGCGYPSSTSCGSSLILQSEFIKNVFQAWDTYYDNVKLISLFKTTDWSQSYVDTLAIQYGLPNDSTFKEFLGSLGLRTYPGNGTNKPAYDTLICQLEARGFCITTCTHTSIFENEINDSSVSIYPNPASTRTILKTDFPLKNAIITVKNCFGQTIKEINNINEQTVTLFCDEFSSGLYFIYLYEGSKIIAIKKLILFNN